MWHFTLCKKVVLWTFTVKYLINSTIWRFNINLSKKKMLTFQVIKKIGWLFTYFCFLLQITHTAELFRILSMCCHCFLYSCLIILHLMRRSHKSQKQTPNSRTWIRLQKERRILECTKMTQFPRISRQLIGLNSENTIGRIFSFDCYWNKNSNAFIRLPQF
jgi:hypothetical protein